MWIFKKLFNLLGKLPKLVWQIILWIGIALGLVAGGEVTVAHKRNKRAESIKARAIKKHDEGRIKVETTLESLGQTKLEIYDGFGQLADAIESIQQRPKYELSVEGIELPSFEPTEFKKLAMGIEVAVGGVGGVVAGGAVGVAAMGTGTLLALAPGALLGGVVLCAMGAKMMGRAAEKVKQAKKIEEDVDKILLYYKELDKVARKFHKAFLMVQEPYNKRLKKVQKIIARKTDWEKFSKAERREVENAILLAQILCRMCAVNLKKSAASADAIETVNALEVDQIIEDADVVCERVKRRIVA